jgi:hypothetical protein
VAAALLATGVAATAATPIVAPIARAQAQPAIQVADSSINYGQAAVIRGTAGPEHGGAQVSLEYGSARGWHVLKTVTARHDGSFGFVTRLRSSGALRVALGDAAAVRASGPVAGAAAVARSATRRVTVAARIAAPVRRLDVRSGGVAVVRGRIAPHKAGRKVRLEVLNGGWRVVDSARTDARGGYTLTHRVGFVGARYARVVFRGDAANAGGARRIGRIYGYRSALASRYDQYGGPLACGGSLGYNAMVVAHKTLPCGTRLRISYRGRTVTATVRDRGPYVGGREFDLAGAVARRLGFNGVGRIWVTR